MERLLFLTINQTYNSVEGYLAVCHETVEFAFTGFAFVQFVNLA